MMSAGFLPAIKQHHQPPPQNSKPEETSTSSSSSWSLFRQVYNFIEEEDRRSLRRAQAFALRPISSDPYHRSPTSCSSNQVSPEKTHKNTSCRKIRATFDNSQLQKAINQSNVVVLDKIVSPSDKKILNESMTNGHCESTIDIESNLIEKQPVSPKKPMRQYRHSMPSITHDHRAPESDHYPSSPVRKFNSEEIDVDKLTATTSEVDDDGTTTETQDLMNAIADMDNLDKMISTDLLSLRGSH